jgi:hypothetical protein
MRDGEAFVSFLFAGVIATQQCIVLQDGNDRVNSDVFGRKAGGRVVGPIISLNGMRV